MNKQTIKTKILYTFATLGIYAAYWLMTLTDEIKEITNNKKLSGGKVMLLTIFTLGIYGFYYFITVDKLINETKYYNRISTKDNKKVYIILHTLSYIFPPLIVVNYALIQNEINKLSKLIIKNEEKTTTII